MVDQLEVSELEVRLKVEIRVRENHKSSDGNVSELGQALDQAPPEIHGGVVGLLEWGFSDFCSSRRRCPSPIIARYFPVGFDLDAQDSGGGDDYEKVDLGSAITIVGTEVE